MKNKNVLISGAGIAGFTLAYWLKKRGFNPTIVEKHKDQRGGGYKVDIRGTALDVVKKMGIYEELLAANVNLKSSKIVTHKFKEIEFKGDILGHCSDDDLEINRWDLAKILKKAAGDVEVIYDDSITVLRNKVHFEHGPPREFDIVIGADGIYSSVRKLLFHNEEAYLKEFGVNFCIFPASNIFNLEDCELVFFKEGLFIAAYAAKEHSYVCFASKDTPRSKEGFYEKFKDIGWKVPELLKEMKNSDEAYFSTLSQIRMPKWSKDNVALVGDAAHATSGMGTSLAITGPYVLAKELEKANGDYKTAFKTYEEALRTYVKNAQELAAKNHDLLANDVSSFSMRVQLFIIKLLPGTFIKFLTRKGKKEMYKVARAYSLESDDDEKYPS